MISRNDLRLQFFCWLLVLSATMINPQNVLAQDGNRFLKWSYQDAGGLLRTIAPQIPLFAIAGGASLATGIRIDEPFQDDVRESYHNKGVWRSFLNITNEIGGPAANLPVAGIFTATLFTKNTKLQDAAFTSMQSWLYTGLISYSLKRAFGRYRPEDGYGASKFKPLSANSSFPSGHTAAAFALITPWVLYYPHPVTYALFGLSTGTAIARLARNKHWPTDVLAGAAIGFFTGKYLVQKHRREIINTDLKISTAASANSFVLIAKW